MGIQHARIKQGAKTKAMTFAVDPGSGTSAVWPQTFYKN